MKNHRPDRRGPGNNRGPHRSAPVSVVSWYIRAIHPEHAARHAARHTVARQRPGHPGDTAAARQRPGHAAAARQRPGAKKGHSSPGKSDLQSPRLRYRGRNKRFKSRTRKTILQSIKNGSIIVPKDRRNLVTINNITRRNR